jgi:DNA-binding IclR family transcriptional regulator
MPPQTNTSVDQIFDALNVLGATPDPVGVAELARTLGLPTSTAHRLLVTLQDAGFAERDTTGSKYELGVRAHQLVHGLFRQYGLASVGEPFIRRLVAATGETVTLDVRVGWYAVRMAGLEGSREIHAAPRIGRTERLGDSVAGRAILATLDDADVARYHRWSGASLADLAEVVRAVREAGHAHEALAGMESAELALPVRRDGRAVAALSIEGTGPAVAPEPRASDLKRIRRVVADLETLVAREPELARDPFAHVDPDELELDAPPPADDPSF